VSDATPHIGTLREKPLHAALKEWYREPDDRVEVPVDGFVIDLVRDDLLIEIQTRGFASMKTKAHTLLEKGHHLRIVHPIPVNSWIVKIDDAGTIIDRRLSPKHGQISDVFVELVSFPEALVRNSLEVEVVLTAEEQIRRHNPGESWRRKGWTVIERRLVEVMESTLLADARGLAELLPDGLPETFTTADIAAGLRTPRRAAQRVAYCLRKTGIAEPVGKRGNEVEYRLCR
jgi:hypothetical protein